MAKVPNYKAKVELAPFKSRVTDPDPVLKKKNYLNLYPSRVFFTTNHWPR